MYHAQSLSSRFTPVKTDQRLPDWPKPSPAPSACLGMQLLAMDVFESLPASSLCLTSYLPALFNTTVDLDQLAQSTRLAKDLLAKAKDCVEKAIDRLCLNDPFFLASMVTLEPGLLERMLKVHFDNYALEFDLASLRSPCWLEVNTQLLLFDFRIDLKTPAIPIYGNYQICLPWQDPFPSFFEDLYCPKTKDLSFSSKANVELSCPFWKADNPNLLQDVDWLGLEEDRFNFVHDWFVQREEDFYDASLGRLFHLLKTDDHARQLLLIKWSQWTMASFLELTASQVLQAAPNAAGHAALESKGEETSTNPEPFDSQIDSRPESVV
ncbi:hypothetical protein [Allobaculum sp. JKK-2023]|uniref:hypothetical protein n=1 Tax=Allobaculum sp. JKK-2023 TaxID=3108943 RepID=UPI002B0627D0|nr:hypothetical protein [Allobaculum sp. JKK-2023]